ncbi:hypothetical protein CO173_04325 [Candidatus Uhrbacteria bacterium CG_4_9_14_3_um_filter_41_35]|uniref:Host attachment protein n=1 Tax=Candidatus Uhrbacteria bacterium CG_4_9_14_3_um_filter_41_35 TaxID=1975034 RepID=A0A2M7XDE9_9BACT|nr:MAG: hypothetical protein COV92_03485 [Candidatus Uhrbacteria bacterium CG11_big_fil_rev_8_21_14_0_20_41_9]PJA45909.1 MAG: hypothetical protein CO173_04325 [Candidatus Uhrbacteria bacterium CG_4_9_14_3_um_filter_41_35]
MQISDHYLAYKEKTLLVVTNNELAKIYSVFERDVEELRTLKVKSAKPDERAGGTANSAPPDLDEVKKHDRLELYKSLNKLLFKLIKEDYKKIIICVPEAHKNEIVEEMHQDVKKLIGENVVPKNLASLPLDQMMRILQESKA